MAEPIQRLLQKGAVFNFGAVQRAAMDSIRQKICKEGKALKRYNIIAFWIWLNSILPS